MEMKRIIEGRWVRGAAVAMLAAVIFVLTFPWREPDITTGLDGSWRWALNWMFANDYERLTQLCYPLGPLGMLIGSVTVGHNVTIALLFYCVTKLALILCGFRLGRLCGHGSLYSAVFVYLACVPSRPEVVMVMLCLLLLLLWLGTDRWGYFVAASLLASVSVCVKISVGIETLSMLFLSWLLYCWEKRSLKGAVLYAAVVLGTLILTGTTVFLSAGAFLDYCLSSLRLTSGYGEALSIEYNFGWIFIGVAVVVYGLLVWRGRNTWFRRMAFVMLLTLFSYWKHAVVRSDASHYMQLVFIALSLGAVMMLVARKVITVLPMAVCVVAICLSYTLANEGGWNYIGSRLAWCNIRHFDETCLHHSDYVARFSRMSEEHLERVKLPAEILKEIGQGSIDFYPWMQSYAAANRVSWQPRMTLESGSSMSAAIQPYASANYEGEKAVHYVLWHEGEAPDRTFDGRYFLNDEPMSVFHLMNHYSVVARGRDYSLLRKESYPRFGRSVAGDSLRVEFCRPVEVPEDSLCAIRVRVSFRKSLIGRIKSFLFKDELYYITYHLSDGSRKVYRFVPSTATLGLWVSPFYASPASDGIQGKVERISFDVTDPACVENEIGLVFEHIPVLQH